jgi:hypothetical protein
MRKLAYQIGTGFQSRLAEDPWRRRMPTQVYIGRETTKRHAGPAKPVTFGKRTERPATVMTDRRFSLARLTSFFRGPRKTRRTKLR